MTSQVKAGVLAAAAAGGVMVALTGWAGKLGAGLLGVATLTALLLLAGAGFGLLIETGRLRLGFGPGILFWLAAFAAARLIQEGMLGLLGQGAGFVEGIIAFAAYQALVGGAFGLGYLLLYQLILTGLERGRSPAGTGANG